MSRTRAFFVVLPALTVGLVPLASAQVAVLRDHLSSAITETNPDIYNSSAYLNFNQNPPGFNSIMDSRAISGFQGDGRRLHTYSAYYVVSCATPSSPRWNLVDFQVSFWSAQSHMESDPRLLSPQAGDRSYTLVTPSNANWQTPVGYGWDGGSFSVGIFLLEFNLDGAGIDTILGQEQFISVQPRGDFALDTGLSLSLASSGGAGTIGTSPGWIWHAMEGFPPGLMSTEFPNHFSLADRITTIPGPSTCLAFALLGTGTLRRRR